MSRETPNDFSQSPEEIMPPEIGERSETSRQALFHAAGDPVDMGELAETEGLTSDERGVYLDLRALEQRFGARRRVPTASVDQYGERALLERDPLETLHRNSRRKKRGKD